MSKAEEKALQEYSKSTPTFIVPNNILLRDAYIKGYRQAEKDLELSLEDIEKIIKIHTDIYLDFFINDNGCKVDTKEYYQEVLKRFKEKK